MKFTLQEKLIIASVLLAFSTILLFGFSGLGKTFLSGTFNENQRINFKPKINTVSYDNIDLSKPAFKE